MRAGVVALVAVVIAACGGATTSPLLVGDDGGGGADASTTDGGSRPTVESLRTCTGVGTCELGAPGCCGINCQSASELVAIRRGESASLVAATCETPNAPCPGCAAQLDPNIQAFCTSGRCEVVDLRTAELSSCAGAGECVLRYASCCQPCDGGAIGEIVAIRGDREGDLALQLCSGAERCDRCLPAFPPNVRAVCNESTRHCAVVTR